MLIKELGRAKSKLVRAFGKEPSHNADFATNGEAEFLKFISGLPEIAGRDCAIDVGANIGEWTAAALPLLAPRGLSKFFCVEPIPPFARQIEERFADRKDVHLIREIFSRAAGGETEIFEIAGGGRLYRSYRGEGTKPHADASAASGKVAVPHKVAISSGDAHFADTNLKPYIIKIDCDGHDLPVLAGFARTLRNARPVVQFEYSDFWIAAGARLREACALLRDCRYRTYKMFPDRLIAFRYNAMYETFGYQNIIAVPEEFSSISGSTVLLR
jgi:FkbM family methyltransferase